MSNRFIYILLSVFVVFLFGGFSVLNQRTGTDDWLSDFDSESLLTVKLFEGRTGRIVITDTIDLNGQEAILPKGATLVFRKGGRITNGRLVGNNTNVVYRDAVFDRVHIKGTWNIPKIRTSMFADLDYENSLKDVMALSNPEVRNVIVIEKGDYLVTAKKNEDVCLSVNSNTTLTINGTICLTPNAFRNYYIVQATGDNIIINGNGTIIGDKYSHIGKDGEWGMGIELRNAHYVFIKDLTVRDCWGDCIYVGDQSSNVKIQECNLDKGRRQGISITSGENIIIKDCIITNVGGTHPEYAIDIEPNMDEMVKNVTIDRVTVEGCKGGFLVWGKAQGAIIDGVTIKRSTIGTTPKIPMIIENANNVTVNSCFIDATAERTFISYKNISNGVITGNKLSIKPTLRSRLSRAIKNNNDLSQMIITSNSNDIVLKDNLLYKSK